MNQDNFESDNPELKEALQIKELSDELENEELAKTLENRTLANFTLDERVDLARELIREQLQTRELNCIVGET